MEICYLSNNIFGFSVFAGLDRSHIDSNKQKEAKRVTSVKNNLFCLNKNLVIPGGGMMMRVNVEDFADVDALSEVTGNKSVTDAKVFNGKLITTVWRCSWIWGSVEYDEVIFR